MAAWIDSQMPADPVRGLSQEGITNYLAQAAKTPSGCFSTPHPRLPYRTRYSISQRPRPMSLLSDNGPSYVSSELGKWLEDNGIRHIRGRPYHPMTQGKIERYHRSMKNRILLDNYYLPGQLERSIEEFVRYYNNCRYHESLDNLTPADVYFGRGQAILERREKIKRKTIEQRRRLHQLAIAA